MNQTPPGLKLRNLLFEYGEILTELQNNVELNQVIDSEPGTNGVVLD